MKLSIIIPCFNEVATIREVYARVKNAPLPDGWEKEIIIIDDGSDAATKDVLRSIESEVNGPIVLYRPENGGKGAAVKAGLGRASGEYILIHDADLEYDPSDHARLLVPIIEKRADAVFGSRALGMNNVPYNAIYFHGGQLLTRVFNVLFRTRITDMFTCYKLFPRTHIPALLRSSHDDFVFDAVDLTLELVRNARVAEVPISYMARSKRGGKKLNWLHGIEIVLAILLARVGVASHVRSRASKVVRFLISGISAAAVHFTVLYVLTEFGGLWYLFSSAIAFVCAFALSFMLQKYWTFRNMDADKIRPQMFMHFTLASFNLCLNLTVMYALVEFAGLWYMLAQAIASSVIAIESFFALRWIFR